MEVKQIYTILNSVQKAVLGGEAAIVNEDLTGIVELGTEIFNANAVDNYVKTLVDHIGKMVFVARKYGGRAPSVLMDNWEFGSVVEKVSMKMPEAIENKSWDLIDKQSYDVNTFYKTSVSVKFFNNLTTFQVPLSITEMQVKESFSNAEQMNSFLSMIYVGVDNTLTLKTDALIMRAINNMIGETLASEYPGNTGYAGKSGKRAVNLLALYKNQFGDGAITADNCLNDPAFIRFCIHTMKLIKSRLAGFSTIYNVGGQERFTPEDKLHCVLLDMFASGAETYLYSGTNQFNNEYIKLPEAETVQFWQSPGANYEFSDTSTIDIKTSGGNTVKTSGILGVMFDHEAVGVSLFNKRTTTNYNPSAEFYNLWFKQDARYFNDLNENFVVFFVA